MRCNLAFFKQVPSPEIVSSPDFAAIATEENPWNFEATARVPAIASR
jgi:hypothetical protein